MPRACRAVFTVLTVALGSTLPGRAWAEDDLPQQARAALHRATRYFVDHVAYEGGYLYHYTEDLSAREGEDPATATMVWVQPPGTPSVGQAYLLAYEATGDDEYLDAARRAAMCLVRGQLRSGGWGYSIEFDPALRARFSYRADGQPAQPPKNAPYNVTVLDDNNSQSAARLLMLVDRALEFKDVAIHEAARFALDQFVAAQYPNGAWPQRFSEPPDPAKYPVKPASYPDAWSRTWPKPSYSGYYTFNDNVMGDMVELLCEAARIYDEPKYLASAKRCGDFIILAQMPAPQRGWAQQYDADMHPAWARKFEPPAVTAGESQSILLTLVYLCEQTADPRYLAPVPDAIAWLKATRFSDGQFARFYELRTNKPLYFTKDYQLTYSDADMPTHYGFKTSTRLGTIQRRYDNLKRLAPEQIAKYRDRRTKIGAPSEETLAKVRAAVAALDDQGRWLNEGKLLTRVSPGTESRILRSDTFVANVRLLAGYLAAVRAAESANK